MAPDKRQRAKGKEEGEEEGGGKREREDKGEERREGGDHLPAPQTREWMDE